MLNYEWWMVKWFEVSGSKFQVPRSLNAILKLPEARFTLGGERLRDELMVIGMAKGVLYGMTARQACFYLK